MNKLALLTAFLCAPALAWSYGGYYGGATKQGKKAATAGKGTIAVQGADGSVTYVAQPGSSGAGVPSMTTGGAATGSGGVFSNGVFSKPGGGGGFQTNVLSKPTTSAASKTAPANSAGAASAPGKASPTAAVATSSNQSPCPAGQTMLAGKCVNLPNPTLGASNTGAAAAAPGIGAAATAEPAAFGGTGGLNPAFGGFGGAGNTGSAGSKQQAGATVGAPVAPDASNSKPSY